MPMGSDDHTTTKDEVSRWIVVAFGLFVALLWSVQSALLSTMALRCNWSAPMFTCGLLNLALSTCLIYLYIQRRADQSSFPNKFLYIIPMEGKPWAYLITGFLSLEALFLSTLSLAYTTLTSSTVLITISAPAAMIFSKILMTRNYTWFHKLGMLACMAGSCINMLNDFYGNSSDAYYDHKIRGDMFAILSGVCYGLLDAVSEYSMQSYGSNIEYLGATGFFATCMAAVQAYFLESDQILAFFNYGDQENVKACSLLAGFVFMACIVLVQISYWVGYLRFLEISDCAFFNILCLTGTAWSAIFSVIIQGIVPSVFTYCAILLVMIGGIMYHSAPSPVPKSQMASVPEEAQTSSTVPADEEVSKSNERIGNIVLDEHSSRSDNTFSKAAFGDGADDSDEKLLTTSDESSVDDSVSSTDSSV